MTTERMPIVSPETYEPTPDESWKMSGEGAYGAAEKFAVDKLGHGASKRKCLVIGSPLPEIRSLAGNGWRITHVDIRRPPDAGHSFLQCDATRLLIPDEEFDAVSSTCVMCHAGLGRYGDPLVANGDVLMLQEIRRVLKPGGVAAIMPGPTLPSLTTSLIYGNVHRIYTQADLLAMVTEAGLECVDGLSVSSSEVAPDGCENYVYVSMLLRKP